MEFFPIFLFEITPNLDVLYISKTFGIQKISISNFVSQKSDTLAALRHYFDKFDWAEILYEDIFREDEAFKPYR